MADTGAVSDAADESQPEPIDQAAIERILSEFVDRHADVDAAVFGSADGHPIAAARDGLDADPATLAAMGAAAVGLAGQLLRFGGDAGTGDANFRGHDAQVWVIDVVGAATLTVIGRASAPGAVAAAARALGERLATLLHPGVSPPA